MKYAIIAIGDELLIGQVTDTNSGWIARNMSVHGWELCSVRVVSDDRAAITGAIEAAFKECDVVLTTGGLGPTKDDITKSTLCEYFGGEMRLDETTLANVMEVVEKRHLKLNDYTRNQAYVPSTCEVVQNKVGTAPILWFRKDEKLLVSMPGVPFEMQHMMEEVLIPKLVAAYATDQHIEHRTFIVIDIIESLLAMHLDGFEKELPSFIHLAYLPTPGLIRLRLSGNSCDARQLRECMDEQAAKLRHLLGEKLICEEDLPLAKILGNKLLEKGLTVSTAESCTGGNIAHEITRFAGSSSYFNGAVVSYANEVKQNVLKVSLDDIIAHGVVSQPVVEQMVKGACEALNTDCAISTSGIAGPGGAVPGKPVGTVWMAAKMGDRIVSQCCHFPGDRERVINRATNEAIKLLIKLLNE
ncbi:MAG: CinA family nicotinamide mononucleotide deamidase-related protein [Bacteroidales bacterium]|nr:CinA family nicotinamide mononucleotide deamidase-related protein [Bacteroidales bacterium]